MLDVKTLALVNLTLQMLLFLFVLGAAYLAWKKQDLLRHCAMLRIAVALQLVAIVFVMTPAMTGYLRDQPGGLIFTIEMLAHHTLGVVVVALWVYVNLVLLGIVPRRTGLAPVMRVAFFSWVATILMGIYMYYAIYLGG